VDDPRSELAKFSEIIKLDMKATSSEERIALVKRYGSPSCRMLAKKLKLATNLAPAKRRAFPIFRAIFSQARTLHAREIPKNRANCLRLLQAISRDDFELRRSTTSSKGSLALLPAAALSEFAAFGFSSEIHSIKHGLSILGEREIRRWCVWLRPWAPARITLRSRAFRHGSRSLL